MTETTTDAAPPPARWRPVALALALAFGGALVGQAAGLPLGLIWGALLATAIAAFAGADLRVPRPLRDGVIVAVGIGIGARFTPQILEHASQWPVTGALLVGVLVVSTLLCFAMLRRVGGYDLPTAWHAAPPGGMTEMTLFGEQHGGDDRVILFTHVIRIQTAIILLPMLFALFGLYDSGLRDPSGGVAAAQGLPNWLGLLACAPLALLARRLGLPAPMLIGPLFGSAALHMSGLVTGTLPAPLLAGAQIIVGGYAGSRFAGLHFRQIARTALFAVTATLIMLAVAALFALLGARLTDAPFTALVLAYSPGGVTEMSLVALAMHTDAALVATHHLARLLLVVVLAPIGWRFVAGESRPAGGA